MSRCQLKVVSGGCLDVITTLPVDSGPRSVEDRLQTLEIATAHDSEMCHRIVYLGAAKHVLLQAMWLNIRG